MIFMNWYTKYSVRPDNSLVAGVRLVADVNGAIKEYGLTGECQKEGLQDCLTNLREEAVGLLNKDLNGR